MFSWHVAHCHWFHKSSLSYHCSFEYRGVADSLFTSDHYKLTSQFRSRKAKLIFWDFVYKMTTFYTHSPPRSNNTTETVNLNYNGSFQWRSQLTLSAQHEGLLVRRGSTVRFILHQGDSVVSTRLRPLGVFPFQVSIRAGKARRRSGILNHTQR